MCKGFDLAPGPTNYFSSYLNEKYSGNIGDNFVSGTLSADFVSPLNMRGNPVNDVVKYRSLMVGPALMYFKRNRFQELQVQQARYLFRSAAKLPSGQMLNTATKIADMFVDECLEINLESTFNWNNLSEITERALRDMVIKNYANQMDAEFTVNARVYRFALKDIEKPIKEPTVNLSKAGQGILAWSKEAHVKFMIAFRVINDLLLKSCRNNVVYDNGMSEDEFLGKMNSAMSGVPAVATNGVIDATACDSGQGPFTQLIERRIYTRLGVSSEFLDWYFSFREHYVMQSRYVRANMKYVKTSGEPATLLGNTILMAALMNGLIRGKGPMCMAMKGDDGFKRQMGMHINKDLVKQIRKFTPLEFKLDLDVPITFCGYALSGGVLHSNLVRKLIKIASHRFRDYEHFTEYQESLRDWISQIGSEPEKFNKFLSVNAELADRSEEDMLRIYDEIVSFSRIGRHQFESEFEEKIVDLNEQVTNYAEHNESVVTAFGDPLAVFMRKYARVNLSE
jgi:DNA-binding protein Fis